MRIPSVDAHSIDERNAELKSRWPQPPPPEITSIHGGGGMLSRLTIMVGLDEPRTLYIGLDQDTPYGRRQQIGRIEDEHLGDVLRQLCLAFGIDRVFNEIEALSILAIARQP